MPGIAQAMILALVCQLIAYRYAGAHRHVEAVESIVRAMARADLGYGGINFPIDECLACGYSGVIQSVCPACQSEAVRRLRRITGYLSTVDRFNDAKRAELADRAAHTADAEGFRAGAHKRGAERQ